MSRFYVGQEVVCINSNGCKYLQKDKHYIIEKIVDWFGVLGIVLKDTPVEEGYIGYILPRFAPIEQIPESHEIAVKELIEESLTELV